MKFNAEVTQKCLQLAGLIPVVIVDENTFQSAVEAIARRNGWLVYHTRDSRKSAAGFPDLCMVRLSRLVFAELKSEDGVVSAAQQTWLDALEPLAVECYLWRPSAWPKIVEVLK